MKKLLALALCVPALAFAEDITLDNLLRAETDHMIRQNIEAFDLDVGQIVHQRETVDLAKQPVIRMNVDTIYSSLLLDLSEPVEITLPEIDGRYRKKLGEGAVQKQWRRRHRPDHEPAGPDGAVRGRLGVRPQGLGRQDRRPRERSVEERRRR